MEATRKTVPTPPGRVPQAPVSGATLRLITRSPLGAAGLLLVVVVIAVAVFAPLIARYEPNAQDYRERLEGPSISHFMGTDEFGRDLWSRIVHGSRISLQVGFIAVVVGTATGLVLGIVSGYAGGAVDTRPRKR